MNKKPVFIVDIDMTIADCTHRSHFVSGEVKRWYEFFSEAGFDKPILENITLITKLYHRYREEIPELKILFLSGRPNSIKSLTQIWLDLHFPISYSLFLRPSGLYEKNSVFKKNMMREICKDFDVLFYIDDDVESCKEVKKVVSDKTNIITIH